MKGVKDNVKVELRVFATYRKSIAKNLGQEADDVIFLDLAPESTLGDLIEEIGLGDDKAIIALVNGLRQEKSCKLHDGDRVGMFPPVGGG